MITISILFSLMMWTLTASFFSFQFLKLSFFQIKIFTLMASQYQWHFNFLHFPDMLIISTYMIVHFWFSHHWWCSNFCSLNTDIYLQGYNFILPFNSADVLQFINFPALIVWGSISSFNHLDISRFHVILMAVTRLQSIHRIHIQSSLWW